MSAFDPQVISQAAQAVQTVQATGETVGLLAKATQIAKAHPVAAIATGMALAGAAGYGCYKLYQHFNEG